MAKLDCQKKLKQLDEKRDAVLSAVNSLAQYGKALSEAFKRLADKTSDPDLLSTVNDRLTSFFGAWSDADEKLKAWDRDARKFRQDVLSPILDKTKRDKTQNELATACLPLIHYVEAAEPEITQLRGFLDVWRNYSQYVIELTDEWGHTRVGY
jgi:hypothetical protein